MKKFALLSILVLVLAAACRFASAPAASPTATLTPEPAPAVPFSALEPYWSDWVKRGVSSPYEVYCKSSGNTVEYGVHIEAGQAMSFDSWGNPVPPTTDGGLITFRTEGCTYEWINGIKIDANTHLTLKVSLDAGLVYQEGSGKVTLPSGETLVFGSGTSAP